MDKDGKHLGLGTFQRQISGTQCLTQREEPRREEDQRPVGAPGWDRNGVRTLSCPCRPRVT